jgi:hypothetical protein
MDHFDVDLLSVPSFGIMEPYMDFPSKAKKVCFMSPNLVNKKKPNDRKMMKDIATSFEP